MVFSLPSSLEAGRFEILNRLKQEGKEKTFKTAAASPERQQSKAKPDTQAGTQEGRKEGRRPRRQTGSQPVSHDPAAVLLLLLSLWL